MRKFIFQLLFDRNFLKLFILTLKNGHIIYLGPWFTILFTWYFPGSLDVSLKLFEKLVTTFIQVLIDYYFAFEDSMA